MKTITPDALPAALGRPDAPLLVDVLGQAAETPPRALNVPFGDDFAARLRESMDHADQPVLVFGSAEDPDTVMKAGRALEEAGYRRVQCFVGERSTLLQAGGDVSTRSGVARVGHDPKPVIAGVGDPRESDLG